MSIRKITTLNNQIVLNSGSITNPDNKSSVIRNSERVRYDLVNIAEYINGLVYFTFSTLTNSDEYPYDAAESGLSGLTILSNTETDSSFSDVFWLSTGENTGRPKTIKESLEAMEAKLIEQQVNISILERVDMSLISSSIASANEIAYKTKNNTLGVNYTAGSADLSYPLSEYIYRLYKTFFGDVDVEELNTNVEDFPALNFSTEVSQVDIPGCGNFFSLEEELSAVKEIISDTPCDPRFSIDLDQAVFDTQPSNIKGYLTEIINKTTAQSNEILQNATDIAAIETTIGNLQGADLATTETAGVSERATSTEVLTAVGANGNKPLFIDPESFCNAILGVTDTTFNAPTSILGTALNLATKRGVKSMYPTYNGFRESFDAYININGAIVNTAIANFGRHYNVDSKDTLVTLSVINNATAQEGSLIRVKNSGDTGTVRIVSQNGYTFDGLAEVTLNAKECITFMKTNTTENIIVNKYTP